DHSYVAALLLAGEITAEEASRLPNRNIITRAIGIQPNELADVFENELRVDEILLLCTDGLCRGLSDSDIKKVLKNTYDLDEACTQLTYLARRNGASDNITIILVKNEGEIVQ
ncbi:MAG: SpoIIE family protein phosphatase, partial [Clostridiales bacterium]|nr:SpoIIE family protein phosphatase [Clostridiales bacterium]